MSSDICSPTLQACRLLHQGSAVGVCHQLHHGRRWPGCLVSVIYAAASAAITIAHPQLQTAACRELAGLHVLAVTISACTHCEPSTAPIHCRLLFVDAAGMFTPSAA
jgi:hypothetical protein